MSDSYRDAIYAEFAEATTDFAQTSNPRNHTVPPGAYCGEITLFSGRQRYTAYALAPIATGNKLVVMRIRMGGDYAVLAANPSETPK